MNLITVIPITRSKVAETLSYFTSSETPNGAIVSVPLRSKIIHGIVVLTRPVADVKSEIKAASYEIRRAGKVKATAFFPSDFMEACGRLAEYYATNTGAIIRAIVAGSLLENINKIVSPFASGPSIPAANKKNKVIYAVQGDDEDRMSAWRSLIRQEFAKKKSIVFYTPTIEDTEMLSISLQRGIEDYIFTLHGDILKKKMIDTWQRIAKIDHPIVIVATGTFPILPRLDIETVVIERENDRGWINQRMPYLDLRRVIETISLNSNKTIFLADSMLRIETLNRLNNNELESGSPMKWRSISNAKDTLIDMVRRGVVSSSTNKENGKKNDLFRIISPELEALIEKNREDNTRLFIFAVRRGLASITICDDCETIVSCNICAKPVVLHASKESGKNFYMCHKCGEIMNVDITCKNCSGFRLTPLGIGIDRIEQEIRNKFQGIEIIKIDSDTTKTEKQIDHALDKFKEKPGGILLGTELALARIREKIDHVAVASLDSLFALPDFRIQEKIMYTLIRLRELATRSILIQTRKPEEKVFEYGLKGNLNDFFKAVLEERKQFLYPPFSTLIKISIEGKKDVIALAMADIRKKIEPHELDIFPAFTSAIRGNSIIHGLMKIAVNEWPDDNLISKLKSLPENVSIRVDPESLL
jgi:primosomal protein N'